MQNELNKFEGMDEGQILREAFNKHGGFRKVSNSFRSDWCPECGESHQYSNKVVLRSGNDGRPRFFCFSCGASGDVIDVLEVLGYPKSEAIKLVHGDGKSKPEIKPLKRAPTGRHPNRLGFNSEKDDERQKMLNIISESLSSALSGIKPPKEVMTYLSKRGIKPSAIERGIESGVVRFLPSQDPLKNTNFLREVIGEDRLVKSGLLKLGKKVPALAFRPILFMPHLLRGFEARAIDVKEGMSKSIRFGSWSSPIWHYGKNNVSNRKVWIVEGGIDLLSILQMGGNPSVVALPGATTWKTQWFSDIYNQYAKQSERVEFVIALDNDDAGNENSTRLFLALQEELIVSTRKIPVLQNGEENKDWNELLQRHPGYKFPEEFYVA